MSWVKENYLNVLLLDIVSGYQSLLRRLFRITDSFVDIHQPFKSFFSDSMVDVHCFNERIDVILFCPIEVADLNLKL